MRAEEVFPFAEEPVDRADPVRLTSYADVLTPAREAVVSVATASIVQSYRRGDPREEFLRRFFGLPREEPQRPSAEPEERRVPNGLGSGVIISADGYILTNNHVVVDERGESADSIMVQIDGGAEYEATLIGRDPRTDIALLRVEAEDLPFIPLADSDLIEVGDIVFAIGNPLGVGQTTTMGIISAIGRSGLGLLGSGGYENFIQTDAAINRGNSGGALVDAHGRLVGINSAILSPVGANIGIGFAIPSRIARWVALELLEYGEVRRGYLGVSITDIDDVMAENLGLASTAGVLVAGVQEGTPAAEAGIEREDVIVAVAGNAVSNSVQLRFQIARIRPGDPVEIEVIRQGERKTFEVTLASLDESAGDGAESGVSDLLEGVTLRTNTDELSSEWGLEVNGGVLVTEVDARSAYATVLRPGMLIVEINGREVDSVAEARRTLRSGANRLWVHFRGANLYIAIRVP